MRNLYIGDSETGTHIEDVMSIEEGLKIISEYENADLKNGLFTNGFYSIYEDGISKEE